MQEFGGILDTSSQRTRVAILGGGIGALTAALELSDPDQKGRYDITVYQLGWRLGGKCASGRNRLDHDAIQEHGLHVFFGFYDNAFQVLRSCYEELGRDASSPFPTLFDALARNDSLTLMEEVGGRWEPWAINCPPLPGLPGDPDPPSLWSVVISATRWLLSRHHDLMEHSAAPASNPAPARPHWWNKLFGHVHLPGTPARTTEGGFHLHSALAAIESMVDDARKHETEHHFRIAELLELGWNEVRHGMGDPLSWPPQFRHAAIEADLVWANLCGLLRDGLLIHPYSATQKVNEKDYRDWLAMHGAHQVTVNSAPIRALYDLIFAYPDGDIAANGNVEAGSLVNALMQLWRYRGSITWKMRAGTGDVVVAPMYEVLRNRGVKFEFFARVSELVPDEAGTAIRKLVISRQVNLKNNTYEPLFVHKGLPCWPDRPLFEQIIEGQELRDRKVDLESRWTDWKDTGGEQVLHAGTDFDFVLLGISKAGLPEIAGSLIAQKAAWKDMIAAVRTVETQSVQLHLDTDLAGTGWTGPKGTLAGAYDASPLDTWADISEILPQEDWGSAGPKSALILCGPLKGPPEPPEPSRVDYPAQAKDAVTRELITFLEAKSAPIWPNLNGKNGFDWNALHDDSKAAGPARLAAQYVRANIDPSERYVQSVAGSSKHRLRADGSGYANLFLTGDWIANPQSLGSFEASVISGKLASRAISGLPARILRVADDNPFLHHPPVIGPQRHPTAAYVVHGGVQTFGGDIAFKNTTMWAFFLPADIGKISALTRKLFFEPTAGALDYVPLTSHVMLAVSDFPEGRFLSYPNMGYSRERELAVFTFLGKRKFAGSPIIERIVAFCPYLFLDNPIARTTGREVFGYQKQAGWIDIQESAGHPSKIRIDAFGTSSSGKQALWDRQPFISFEQVAENGGQVPVGSKVADFEGLAEIVQTNMEAAGFVLEPGLKILEQIVMELRKGIISQLFLKQFRDIQHTDKACYQAIAESPAQVTSLHGLHYQTKFRFKAEPLLNIPLCEELGIPPDCQTDLALRLVLDMKISDGNVLWKGAW